MVSLQIHNMAPFVLGALLLLAWTSSAIGQTISEASSKTEAIVKISGASPAVGASFSLGNSGILRLLGFFSTNFKSGGPNNQYFIGVSYLRKTDRLAFESLRSYWGVDFSVIGKGGVAIYAPGLAVGTSYYLNDRFAVFGEAGLNLFLHDNGSDELLGMFNSGVGVKIGL